MTSAPRRHASAVAAWFAILALWLQALLPAVHHPAGAMAGPFGLGMAGSLCLAPGGAPLAPQDKAPGHKAPPCPICQTLQILAGGFAPPAATAIPLPHRSGPAAVFLGIDRLIPAPPRVWPQGRAPPLPT